jgi:hypothetical protein
MNALLIYPEFPGAYWGFKHALKFLGTVISAWQIDNRTV